jgi:gamma-F420-2:alpha-L-glutamate ligase
MNGWVVYNGNIAQGKFLDFAQWIQEAASKQNIRIKIIKNNELLVTIENGKSMIKGKYKDEKPDFVFFADKDIQLASQLEKIGIRVYNSASAIDICDNKNKMYQALADHEIPLPKTIIAPMIFQGLPIIDMDHCQFVIKEIGFPMIIKEAYGSFGEQVYLIHNDKEMEQKIKELNGTPYLFQEFIQTSYGQDLRLNVVGENVVASMKRVASDDFRANVSAGGKMEKYIPSMEEMSIAINAAKAVGACFAGVDLLFGADGPIVCEVNSNAHIRNIFDCTGVNIADHMIRYIMEDIHNEL